MSGYQPGKAHHSSMKLSSCGASEAPLQVDLVCELQLLGLGVHQVKGVGTVKSPDEGLGLLMRTLRFKGNQGGTWSCRHLSARLEGAVAILFLEVARRSPWCRGTPAHVHWSLLRCPRGCGGYGCGGGGGGTRPFSSRSSDGTVSSSAISPPLPLRHPLSSRRRGPHLLFRAPRFALLLSPTFAEAETSAPPLRRFTASPLLRSSATISPSSFHHQPQHQPLLLLQLLAGLLPPRRPVRSLASTILSLRSTRDLSGFINYTGR